MTMFEPKNILVPTDFSVYSDYSLKQAVDIAKSSISLFHVIDDGFQQCSVDYCLDEGTVRKIVKDSIDYAQEKLLLEAKMVTNSNPDMSIDTNVKRGIPYEQILNEQEEKKIDLIVIASHGKTGILKNLMGGVVEKILRRSTCPILLVRC